RGGAPSARRRTGRARRPCRPPRESRSAARESARPPRRSARAARAPPRAELRLAKLPPSNPPKSEEITRKRNRLPAKQRSPRREPKPRTLAPRKAEGGKRRKP